LERDQPTITPDAEPTEEESAAAAARNADFGPIKEGLMREAGLETEQRNDYRVIEIDLNVVPAEEHEIEEPEEESSDEDYDPADDVEDDDKSLE